MRLNHDNSIASKYKLIDTSSDYRQKSTLNEWPKVTIVIPTLNSEIVLAKCLSAIQSQSYPKHLIEVLVVDGGSSDRTCVIASEYSAEVVPNPLKTGEAGKAVGAARATGDIIAFIDSDNFLSNSQWIELMVAPFSRPEIMASEPLYWDYHHPDLSYIDRYCALTGVNDPLCLYLGNYGRYSYLTGKWTGLDVSREELDEFFIATFQPKDLVPTMGANGFLIRATVYNSLGERDMLFDIDLITEAARRLGTFSIARVPTSISHLYTTSWRGYRRKAMRRAHDFFYFSGLGQREYPWAELSKYQVFLFTVSSILIVPTLFQACRGYLKVRDNAWFFHPIACLITVSVYVQAIVEKTVRGAGIHSREGWRQ